MRNGKKKPDITSIQPPGSSGSGSGAILTLQNETVSNLEYEQSNISYTNEITVSEPETTEKAALGNVVDFLPEYPPVYQLIQMDENTVELETADETPLGEWVSSENGWSYYADPGNTQPIPAEDGSIEVIDPDGMPIGLWNKNEDDEWAYEEYTAMRALSRWLPLFISLIALSGLLWYFYLFFMNRSHVTREEFTRMLVEAVRLEAEIDNIAPYNDVAEDIKYYYAVMRAKAAGFLTGFPGSEFKPENTITREEIASILAEAARYANVDIPNEKIDLAAVFRDFKSMNELYLADIQMTVSLGLMHGESDGGFHPGGLSSRKHAEKYINSLLEIAAPY